MQLESQPSLIIDEAPTRILIVDDNKIDVRLTRKAIELADWPATVQTVDDGEKAVQFLRRETLYEAVDTPGLVILDLNLPKYDGTEVLRFIRASEDLRNLLVFIFSSSPVEVTQDKIQNARVKADSYFEKPSELGTYFSIAAQIKATYLRAAGGRVGASA